MHRRISTFVRATEDSKTCRITAVSMVAPPTVHDKGVSAQRELVLHVMSGSVSSARHSWDRALSDIQTHWLHLLQRSKVCPFMSMTTAAAFEYPLCTCIKLLCSHAGKLLPAMDTSPLPHTYFACPLIIQCNHHASQPSFMNRFNLKPLCGCGSYCSRYPSPRPLSSATFPLQHSSHEPLDQSASPTL